MTEPHAMAYVELRGRVSEVVRDVDPSILDRPAPATPGWRARDVLAHMVGVTDDVVNGRLDGIATDPWTAAQVDKRKDVSIAELLADWEYYGPDFEKLLAQAPEEIAGQAIYDAMTHEHDLRHAIARPGARDNDAAQLSWEWVVTTRTGASAPAIRFVTEYSEHVAGVGEPKVTVGASRFELLRATTGRRTVAEIESYTWDPAPDVSALLVEPFFTIRTDSLGE